MCKEERRCHTSAGKKKPAQKRRPKTGMLPAASPKKNAKLAASRSRPNGQACMFSASNSWLSSFIPGRSSDLAIMALRRLPGEPWNKSPVTYLARSSRLTATSSCRICTCFPFHPGIIPGTADALFTWGYDSTDHLDCQKHLFAVNFKRNPLQNREKRVSYSPYMAKRE